eukprot:m51a1_g6499 hypothetical protein (292) ;mRNA; f:205078-206018
MEAVVSDVALVARLMAWLGPVSASRCAAVSRAWRSAASSPSLWRQFLADAAVPAPATSPDPRTAYAEWHAATRRLRAALARLPEQSLPLPRERASLRELRAADRSLGFEAPRELCALLAHSRGGLRCWDPAACEDAIAVAPARDVLAAAASLQQRADPRTARCWRRLRAVWLGRLVANGGAARDLVCLGASGAVLECSRGGASVAAASLAAWFEQHLRRREAYERVAAASLAAWFEQHLRRREAYERWLATPEPREPFVAPLPLEPVPQAAYNAANELIDTLALLPPGVVV